MWPGKPLPRTTVHAVSGFDEWNCLIPSGCVQRLSMVLAPWSAEVTETPAASAPDQVLKIFGSPRNTEAFIRWNAPANNGSAITNYFLQYRTSGQSWSTTRQNTVAGNAVSFIKTGLTNGVRYGFRLHATNGEGNGGWSPEEFVTPVADEAIPEQIQNIVSSAGNGAVDLQWPSPLSNGAEVTNYRIQWKSGSQSYAASRQRDTLYAFAAISGLTNGTPHDFRIRATNSIGDGPWSAEVTETPAASAPDQIDMIFSTAGDGQVISEWSAPADNGAGIIRYEVQWRDVNQSFDSSRQVSVTVTNYTRTGLANGTAYFFRVRAVNSAGNGTFSPEDSANPVSPADVPERVTGVSSTPGNASISYTWQAPASVGSSVSSYTIQWKSGSEVYASSRQATSTANAYTLTGLTNGIAYDVRIRAHNTTGAGAWSADEREAPEAQVPGQITIFYGSPRSGGTYLEWAAPDSNGASITAYEVQWRENSQSFDPTRQATPTATSYNVTGLTNGTNYHFRVRATNSVGNGSYSDVIQETPAASSQTYGSAGSYSFAWPWETNKAFVVLEGGGGGGGGGGVGSSTGGAGGGGGGSTNGDDGEATLSLTNAGGNGGGGYRNGGSGSSSGRGAGGGGGGSSSLTQDSITLVARGGGGGGGAGGNNAGHGSLVGGIGSPGTAQFEPTYGGNVGSGQDSNGGNGGDGGTGGSRGGDGGGGQVISMVLNNLNIGDILGVTVGNGGGGAAGSSQANYGTSGSAGRVEIIPLY